MNKNSQYEYPSIHHRLIGYPYRVWIFSVILTPLLISLWSIFDNARSNIFEILVGSIIEVLIAIPIFIALSFPTIMVYMLVFIGLINTRFSVVWIKVLLSMTALSGISLTAWLLTGSFLPNITTGISFDNCLIVYLSVIFILSCTFNLKES